MVQEVKRGRGRPRKVKTEDIMADNFELDPNIAVPEPIESPIEAVSQTPEVEEAEESSIGIEDLPLGNDPSLLYAGREEKVLDIAHAGQRWQFKYRDLSWGQKNECIDLAQQWDQETGFRFSVSKYYAAALTKMLTDTPIRPITETTLNKLDRSIGEKLTSIVPQPVESAVEDIKKA